MTPDEVIEKVLRGITDHCAHRPASTALVPTDNPHRAVARQRYAYREPLIHGLDQSAFQRAWRLRNEFGPDATDKEAGVALTEALEQTFGRMAVRQHPLWAHRNDPKVHRALNVLAAAVRARDATRMMDAALAVRSDVLGLPAPEAHRVPMDDAPPDASVSLKLTDANLREAPITIVGRRLLPGETW